MNRNLNVGFLGGKKKMEILQMLTLQPKLAILDETDSELDVDYVHILVNGQIVATGSGELAKEIEENGYAKYIK